MGNIGEILARLAKRLGLGSTEGDRIALMRKKLAEDRAENIDQRESLKTRIRQRESLFLRKGAEHSQARGAERKIIEGEMAGLCRELDRLKTQAEVIAGHLERVSIQESALEKLDLAQRSGLAEGEVDDLALSLQDRYEETRIADKATHELERISPPNLETAPVDFEKHLSEITSSPDSGSRLPPDLEKRMRELEGSDGQGA